VHVERIGATSAQLIDVLPEGLTIGDAGATAADAAAYRDTLRARLGDEEREMPREAVDGVLVDVLAGAVVVAAHAAGATVTAPPGEPVRIRHADGVLDPWELLVPIAAGERPAGAWRADPVVAALAPAPLRAGGNAGPEGQVPLRVSAQGAEPA
jgi:hypothetical protein